MMVSTTGEQSAFFELDAQLRPVEKPLSVTLAASVERVRENCEPALCSVLFMAGAGGSLRSGATRNPVGLTHSVAAALMAPILEGTTGTWSAAESRWLEP